MSPNAKKAELPPILYIDIDEMKAYAPNFAHVDFIKYVPESLLTAAEEKLRIAREENEELYRALDLATDLLPVPEHAQDTEWHEKEREVVSIFMRLKFAREALAKLGGADERS